nr:MAG TPA: YcbB domain protein [Caudoviricetes sp.]
MENELKSLDAVEREIKARYNGKYQSVSGYKASEQATRKAITNIFRNVAELGTCDDVLALISGKEYRRTAFINYLQHENYISPIIKACYR